MTTATETKMSVKHSKTTTLHVHITLFCTFFANYCTPTVVQCEIPSSTFHGGCKHNRMTPRFSLQEFSSRKIHLHLTFSVSWNCM